MFLTLRVLPPHVLDKRGFNLLPNNFATQSIITWYSETRQCLYVLRFFLRQQQTALWLRETCKSQERMNWSSRLRPLELPLNDFFLAPSAILRFHQSVPSPCEIFCTWHQRGPILRQNRSLKLYRAIGISDKRLWHFWRRGDSPFRFCGRKGSPPSSQPAHLISPF